HDGCAMRVDIGSVVSINVAAYSALSRMESIHSEHESSTPLIFMTSVTNSHGKHAVDRCGDG
ncbi:hypothetical protein, partial [Natronorubrum bangense]|uniref:hypothetical protein n=1 Tax=Natronorubrum bangense TaxID=61858 RepID=UPI0019D33E2A